MRRRRAPVRLAAAAFVAAVVGAAGPACPSRDLTVDITRNAADTLLTACVALPAECVMKAGVCEGNALLCDTTTCRLKNACRVGENPPWTPEQSMGIRLLVLKVTPDLITVANPTTSGCIPLNLRPCVVGPQYDGGCDAPDSGDLETCISGAIARKVAGALVTGLGFSGFTSTDGVALVVAFFRKPGDGGAGEKSCDMDGSLVLPSDCDVGNLTAVAGFSELSGSSTFDINCASCQNGTRASYGYDNAPCPDIPPSGASLGECFLERVATALAAAPLPQ